MHEEPQSLRSDSSDEITAERLAAVIRQESEAFRLITVSELQVRFPAADLDSMLPSAAETADLIRVEGAAAVYYYSSRSMTAGYAEHLVRMGEHDPVQLVAETVRAESRDYSRPTALAGFSPPPFQLTQSELASMPVQVAGNQGTNDIRSCTASNGAVYLYSAVYLTDLHARRLAEFYAVEVWENP